MSSYVNIFLVPKKKVTDSLTDKEIIMDGIPPLLLDSYCRNTSIYEAFVDELHPPLYGSDVGFSDLTPHKLSMLRMWLKNKMDEIERTININYKILEGNNDEGVKEETLDLEKEAQLVKDTIQTINVLGSFVSACENGYSDFEKVVYNMDC